MTGIHHVMEREYSMEYLTNDNLQLHTKAFITDLLTGVNSDLRIQETIAYLLNEIGIFTHSERICILEPNKNSDMECMYRWTSPSIMNNRPFPQIIPQSTLKDWLIFLQKKQLVIVDNPDTLSNSMREAHHLLNQLHVQTLLMVPIYMKNDLQACLTLVNPDFSAFAVIEQTWLFLGRQIAILFRRDEINHKYMLLTDSIRSGNLSEFIIDYTTGHYEAFRITKVLRNLIPEDGDWNWLRHFYASIIKPEYSQELLKCTEREYMESVLQNEKNTFYIDIEREVNQKNIWFRLEFSPVSFYSDGHLERFVLLVKDITEQKQREEWMQYKIEHDELTGILNRTAFNRITSLLNDTSTPFALVLLDIDKFKAINDTYGHDVGDEVLKHLATVLNEKMRTVDKIFRLGGDEFAVIINAIASSQAESIQQTIDSINDEIDRKRDGIPAFSVSAGVAFSSGGYNDILYRNADQALYKTKETTRKGCTFF